jgi:hypothetical protein
LWLYNSTYHKPPLKSGLLIGSLLSSVASAFLSENPRILGGFGFVFEVNRRGINRGLAEDAEKIRI